MQISLEVNSRIDSVINSNEKHANAIVRMAVCIFILGLIALIYGMVTGNVFIVAPSTLFSAALYWPINEIKKMRKENISLAAIPTLIATLPPDDAARELVKLLARLTE